MKEHTKAYQRLESDLMIPIATHFKQTSASFTTKRSSSLVSAKWSDIFIMYNITCNLLSKRCTSRNNTIIKPSQYPTSMVSVRFSFAEIWGPPFAEATG